MMRVKNRMDLAADACSCGGWLQHWDNYSRQRANFCMVIGCDGKPEAGAWVQKEAEPDRLYVVPLCKACAAKVGQTLEIVNTVNLVSADTEDTCVRQKASSY